jgi:hypothetical protein
LLRLLLLLLLLLVPAQSKAGGSTKPRLATTRLTDGTEERRLRRLGGSWLAEETSPLLAALLTRGRAAEHYG